MQMFPTGPAGQPFIVAGGHWDAAATVLLPGDGRRAVEALKTDAVLASIPHREALLSFHKGTRASRDAMRSLIREKESEGYKALTFELFELTEDGPRPFSE